MTTSDIISMVCSGISLIATIIIAVLQIIQSNRMEKFEHKQDERDEKRHEEDIKAEAVTFISKYYHDRGLIPLCAMAAMHNDLYYYSREMYREFCCKTVEVQNRILKYLELDLQVCNMDDFYKECINALQKLAHFYFPNGKFPFYENGKYIIRSLERYGSEKIPVERIHYKANDIPDNVRKVFVKSFDGMSLYSECISDKLSEAFLNNVFDNKIISELEEVYNFANSSEIEACQFVTTLAGCLASYGNKKTDSKKYYGSPGFYDGETIDTMEDLFLLALFEIYTNLLYEG